MVWENLLLMMLFWCFLNSGWSKLVSCLESLNVFIFVGFDRWFIMLVMLLILSVLVMVFRLYWISVFVYFGLILLLIIFLNVSIVVICCILYKMVCLFMRLDLILVINDDLSIFVWLLFVVFVSVLVWF